MGSPGGEAEVWAYHECREEPEEEVAVVLLVDGEVACVTLDVGPWKLSYQTQLPGCRQRENTFARWLM